MIAKTIYCPGCGRKAFVYDGKGSINLQKECKKCKKVVDYSPTKDKVTMMSIPHRVTSSGKRFY